MAHQSESAKAIAVFPFLTTSEPVDLGDFTFRSTGDVSGLNDEESRQVREIADMLFYQDDYRIEPAMYATLGPLDSFNRYSSSQEPTIRQLEDIQAVLAYWFSGPSEMSGEVSVHLEQLSVAVFQPDYILRSNVEPKFGVRRDRPAVNEDADEQDEVPGYRALYNFRHWFEAVKGSRLYPPVPGLPLGVTDLSMHIEHFLNTTSPLLLKTLQPPLSSTSDRVLTALRWYNRANSLASTSDNSVVDLAVAFETLLGLPEGEKTDRFIDAVSMLLGRSDRLRPWAQQFYKARSEVVHEGKTSRLHFQPNKHSEESKYHSLLAYGRLIFRPCLNTLLSGAEASRLVGLEEKLISNQERFKRISEILDDETLEPAARFMGIKTLVQQLEAYQYFDEPELSTNSMLGAARKAAQKFPFDLCTVDQPLRGRIEALASANRSEDWYEVLKAVHAFERKPPNLDALFWPERAKTGPESPEEILVLLVDVVRSMSFPNYWLLQRQRQSDLP